LNNILTKNHRISKKTEISSLLKNGKRWKCLFFHILYIQNNDDKDRCAVIVGKKTGNAVIRNRTKRVYREIFRHYKSASPPFTDLLIRPTAAYNKNIRRELEKNFLVWKDSLKK
jgi:ribonuclease P protein component